jgi:plasmid rolling circle replication initiator protein Rep
MDKEFLQDEYIVNGKKKVRPWRVKKMRALALGDSYERLGYEKKCIRVRYCGRDLTFDVNPETKKKTLVGAWFCRERLCPMCAWRKSLRVFHDVSRVMDEVQRQHENLVPIFLTLTVRNCTGEELAQTITSMSAGWSKMLNNKGFATTVNSWFRALEVTYNAESDTYHPHFHAILLVDKQYFKSKKYKTTADWVHLWRVSAKLDYDPICDIRKVKVGKQKYKAVAEVAKYTMKDKDYIFSDTELMDKVVHTLTEALYKRRLFAYGGVMRVIAKTLGVKDPEEADLVHMDDENIREDVEKMLVTYRWDYGLVDYVRRR